MTLQPNRASFDLSSLSSDLGDLGLPARLRRIRDVVPGTLTFTTSFGLEDQALTHAIVDAGIRVSFATLDTGRLFDETLEVWAETELLYGIGIKAFAPADIAVEDLLRSQGPLGFRRSLQARQDCCAVRKVEPLGRALAGSAGWLTGLRADQSRARADTPFVSNDAGRPILKISPLADWSRDEVASYVARNAVPYNSLHDRGFLSIGCAPCTRAVHAGEDERAGRWWWEAESKKECGLHNRPQSTSLAALLAAQG